MFWARGTRSVCGASNSFRIERAVCSIDSTSLDRIIEKRRFNAHRECLDLKDLCGLRCDKECGPSNMNRGALRSQGRTRVMDINMIIAIATI